MADPTTGTRLLPACGNAQSRLYKSMRGLADGTYYWSVQAIDTAFAGSTWPQEQMLVLQTRKISGFVTDGAGAAFPGVKVCATGGDPVFTDAGGYYELKVSLGWSGAVTSDKLGFVLTPPSREYSNVVEDLPNQNFTAVPLFADVGAGLPGLDECSAAWGDYDNDGDLDLALVGYTGTEGICRVYRNDAGALTDAHAGLPGRRRGSIAWGDYDNDGDLDLVCGSSSSAYTTRIYRNDGGSFVELDAGLPAQASSPAWGDYDNDGDLDLLVKRSSSWSVYRNDKGKFQLANSGLPSRMYGSTFWVDYDKDGDLDIAFAGWISTANTVNLFRSDNGTFVDQGSLASLSGGIVCGDYDNDGDSDLIVCDTRYNSGVYASTLTILRNDAGSFVAIDPGIAFSTPGQMSMVDYDNDGDLDLAWLGDPTYGSSVAKMFRNDGGSFCDSGLSLPPPGIYLAWGDYEGDGDSDFVAYGGSRNQNAVTVYRNNTGRANTVPTPPVDLFSFPTGQGLTFRWKAATDTETPAPGLSYNLRVGSSPGACDFFSGMADSSTGRRLLPGVGNAQQMLSWTLRNLPPCQYFWSVQAVDSGMAGSPWAEEQVLTDISFAKSLSDGASAQVCGVVTAVFDDAFYIEKPDRASGIRVEDTPVQPQVGKIVSVRGSIGANPNEERTLSAQTVSVNEDAAVPQPWLMDSNAIGGGPLGLQAGVSDWRLVKDAVTGVWGRRLTACGGANNIGLLVKATGTIRSVGEHFFYLDGSTAFDDGDEAV